MNQSADHPRFFLGIDGGGTKTRAVIVDAHGAERSSALAGGANAHRVGIERAVAEVIAATEMAATQAGARLPLDAAWFGLAGMDSPADAQRLLPYLAPLARAIHLTNDAELLLSALPNQVGVALIAGTGSIAIGRNATGATGRVGGWGHALGDEGSGYDLGRRALVAAVRSFDGRGEPTSLLEAILAAWELSDAHELIARVYYDPRSATQIARLAPMVLQAALDGDRMAQRIIRHGAAELSRAVVVAASQLGLGGAPLPLALGGSLLLQSNDYRDATLRAIGRSQPIGDVILVEQPALDAARAAPHISTASNALTVTHGEE